MGRRLESPAIDEDLQIQPCDWLIVCVMQISGLTANKSCDVFCRNETILDPWSKTGGLDMTS